MNSFERQLEVGHVLERNIQDSLRELLPDYGVIMTCQERGCQERDDYNLCDVVVLDNGRPVLGIESKFTWTEFHKCGSLCGWPPDRNTPLNDSSLIKYELSDFPFYILNMDVPHNRCFVADIDMIRVSRHDKGITKPSGVKIMNYCTETWFDWDTLDRDFSIDTVLDFIIKREGLL